MPYTRSTEYKHYGPQRSNHTVVVRETSNADQEPYYPVPSQRNRELYARYKALAEQEEARGVYFVGRLANYKYFSMDQAIVNALAFFERIAAAPRVGGANVSAMMGIGDAGHHQHPHGHSGPSSASRHKSMAHDRLGQE